MLKLPTRKNFVIGLGTTLSCLAMVGLSAPASAAYPDKPITVVIGWGPGGGIDWSGGHRRQEFRQVSHGRYNGRKIE